MRVPRPFAPAFMVALAVAAQAQLRARWAPDGTESIQAALDSGAPQIVIPYVGKAWVVRPLHLRNGQTVTFEPGVVVVAQPGAFRGSKDCLLSGSRIRNVTLRGYGATLRMRRAAYAKPPYELGEWRHCLMLNDGSSDIAVLGLTLEASGGDGIYVGSNYKTQPACRNVLIRDVTCRDNLRQGISVTSVIGLRVENCILADTAGSNPQAGIDIEPSLPQHVVQDILVRDCQALGNAGSGLFVNVERLDRTSQPVSIIFESCLVRNSGMAGIRVKGKQAGGSILFRDCTVERSGSFVDWCVPILKYENCRWLSEGGRLHVEGKRE
ncbi:MAG TPA: right-handed parallel beta-helix repeat-containing protein [Phycisphaerae bacterium]|nr:right-handed parallel beta-helix repeat-containing protein [Phycisphaerae bacterium]